MTLIMFILIFLMREKDHDFEIEANLPQCNRSDLYWYVMMMMM
jgi:hypothetical protein